MSLKKLLISGVTALTLATVGATAADATNTSLATDGTGDFLILPYYAATGNWETHLRVVNTNPTDAIVAKVVFRGYKQSAEILDFPIYLSPGDVWEGTVKVENNEVVVKSSDDSLILADYPQKDKTLAMNPERGGKDPRFGYVEVWGVAQIAAATVDPLNFKENYPLDKAKLVQKFKTELNHDRGEERYNGNEWKGVDKDSLYAEEILYDNTNKLAMTLPATALEGVTGKEANSNKIIGADTRIKDMIPNLEVLDQMKSALYKTHIYANFYDGADNTALILTQPLAKYLYGDVAELKGFNYTSLARDTEEHSNIKEQQPTDLSGYDPEPEDQEGCWFSDNDYAGAHGHEICVIDVKAKAGGFENGYVDFKLNSPRAIIPVLMSVKKVGGEKVTNILYTPYKK